MSSQGLQPPAADSPQAARPPGSRRFQIGMLGLIVAVACCGVISWAARTLWESQHPAAAAARELRSTDPGDRAGAARLLSSLGLADPDQAIPPLVDALGDPDAEVRGAAAAALGAIIAHLVQSGSAGPLVRTGIGALIGVLKDRKPSVRIVAVGALHSIAHSTVAAEIIDFRSVIEAIATTLDDRDEQVRLSALAVLTQFGPLSLSGPPASLTNALADRSARVRAAAITTLASFPVSLDPWLDSLLGEVERGDPEVRNACWSAFARPRQPPFSAEAIPRLVKALGSPDRKVRSHAARALYLHGGNPRASAAIPALLAVLREPIDPDLARRLGLGQVVSVRDGDPADMAALVLGRLAPGTESAGEVIAALAEVVRSGHPSRRSSAAGALGEFGPAAEPAVPVLTRALREGLATQENYLPYVGQEAARVLGRIAPGTRSADEAVAALTEALDLRPGIPAGSRLAAIEALKGFGPAAARAIPRLRDGQKSPDGHLRLAAEKALAAIEGAGSGKTVGEPGR